MKPDDSSDSLPRRYRVEHNGRSISLASGKVVIGRSTGAQLVLDDALVSRRHAQLVLDDEYLAVEDLGSVNGVFVNGERVNGSRVLFPGDRVVIGQQELVVGIDATSERATAGGRFSADTLVGLDAAPADSDSESTHQGDALDLLGGVADKVLALGRGDEAEKMLGSYLRNLLAGTRSGRRPPPAVAERAVEYAVKIAAATGKGEWVDYAVELFTALQRPLPASVVDQLFTVLRNVRGVNLHTLRTYVAVLREVSPRFGPTDRFLAQRIEGLERLAAAK